VKGPTRSPALRRAIARAKAIGYEVRFVEFVTGFPSLQPPQGLCDREARRIQVGLRDLGQPGMPTCSRDKLLAILEHELEHAEGKDRATDRPEFGLICGGMRRAAGGTPCYAFCTDEPVRRRYRAFMESRSGMYAQYDGHVDVWCDTDDWDDVFAAAIKELQRTAFPERSAAAWRMTDFQLIG